MKQGVTLLTARGWMDGHVVEVKAWLEAPIQGAWNWNLISITTGDHLAYGRFTGSPRRMANELLNIIEGANDGDDAGRLAQGPG